VVTEAMYLDYIQEWEATSERVVPSSTNRKGRTFPEMMHKWTTDETPDAYKAGFVPSTLYFLVRNHSRIIGAIHRRHELNERLLQNGGNVGYGVRPTERRKGYASLMLKLLLTDLGKRNFGKVLITCDEDNCASAKTIERAGGIPQDKVPFEGVMTRRYWIKL